MKDPTALKYLCTKYEPKFVALNYIIEQGNSNNDDVKIAVDWLKIITLTEWDTN